MNMSTLWTERDLACAIGHEIKISLRVTGISIDTRSLQPGDLFVALMGERHDGHDHVLTAFEKGAAACLVQMEVPSALGPLLQVEDTLGTLVSMARYARGRFTGRMVAVTGSVGKTTTKNMLAAALAAQGLTHAADRSFNNHIGVPLTLTRLPPDAQWCVCEIGMNHQGEIAPLAQLVQPDVAIVTAVGNNHIGHLGSLDAIAEEKAAIFSGLIPHGVAIVPEDIYGRDRFLRAAQTRQARFVTVGEDARADDRIEHARTGAFESVFQFKGHDVSLPVAGHHMIVDAALTLSAVDALSARSDPAIAALAAFVPDAGRGLATPILDGGARLLDESYNASSLSMRAALAMLALWPGKRRIAVLGDMLEMGTHAEAAHLGLLPEIMASADRVFCCGTHMKRVYQALPDAKKAAWRETAASLAPLVSQEVKAGDVILVKGSLGSRMRDVVSALKNQGNKG